MFPRTHARLFAALLLITLGLLTVERPASATFTPTFTYTGQLLVGGSPVSGTYDFQFGLYTAASGGTQIGSTLTATSVPVADGVFYVQLAFPTSSFNGQTLYLQIAYGVHPASSYTYQTPRHIVPTTGYAYYSGLSASTQSLQGNFVSAAAPSAGQVLTWQTSGSKWVPMSLPPTSLPLPYSASASSSSALLSLTNSSSGSGVLGTNSGNGASGFLGGVEPVTSYGLPAGVFGSDTSTNGGYGVDGESVSGYGVGVFGNSENNGYGVLGVSSVSGRDFNGSGTGVYGESGSGTGVYGYSNSGNGVYGESGSGKAGYFSGNVYVSGNLDVGGTLTKGGGSFKIDSPLDPANKFLSHSFVESPDMMNIYNGDITTNAHGAATVKMPAYFQALNQDFRYQLTVIGQFAQAIVATKIHDNTFLIKTDKPNVEVSWMVTGIRHDAWANAHRIPTEELKPVSERGLYLDPAAQGKPISMGIGYAEQQKRQAKN